MFSNIKRTIKELAQTAVAMAEKALGGETGKEKKAMAIKFVIDNLPITSPFLKSIVSSILTRFIDEAIELAVEYMNSLSEETQGETL